MQNIFAAKHIINKLCVYFVIALTAAVLTGCGAHSKESFPAPSYDLSSYHFSADDERLAVSNANLPAQSVSTQDLKNVEKDSSIQLRSEAVDALAVMLSEAEKQGIALEIEKGYSEKSDAECAEHETGFAIDFVSENAFEKSKAYDWLAAYAADYGFILRYPSEKEPETGMKYNSRHWRYVGVENARAIVQSGLSLEAFVAVNTIG